MLLTLILIISVVGSWLHLSEVGSLIVVGCALSEYLRKGPVSYMGSSSSIFQRICK